MKYMGSKNRIAKDILPIILKDRKQGQFYVEPFVGGANMIDKVDGNRIGADNNKYLIALYVGLQNGLWFNDEISKDIYDKARTDFNNKINAHFSDFEIGFMASYNGRFFDGGYSGNYPKRDYIKESISNLLNQEQNLIGIKFSFCDYQDLTIPAGSILYLDKPYENTKQYSTSIKFNHSRFWDWCRKMKNAGHTVFVSEYYAPADFICVWEGKIKTCINSGNIKDATEKLFTL